MTRKIIQIALGLDGSLYALCEDGTLWRHFVRGVEGNNGWKQIPGVPAKETKPT